MRELLGWLFMAASVFSLRALSGLYLTRGEGRETFNTWSLVPLVLAGIAGGLFWTAGAR